MRQLRKSCRRSNQQVSCAPATQSNSLDADSSSSPHELQHPSVPKNQQDVRGEQQSVHTTLQDKLSAYAPGSIAIVPGIQPHFHWAKSGEYMTQIVAIGPLGFSYMDPNNDPRTAHRRP
jgi:hypothetical protein